jgi:hypothetical protein
VEDSPYKVDGSHQDVQAVPQAAPTPAQGIDPSGELLARFLQLLLLTNSLLVDKWFFISGAPNL